MADALNKQIHEDGCTHPGHKSLPIVDCDAIDYVDGFYDGPTNGLCTIDGGTAYYVAFEAVQKPNAPGEWHACFSVFPLTDEEARFDRALQELSVKYEGNLGDDLVPEEYQFRSVRTKNLSQLYKAETKSIFDHCRQMGDKVSLEDRENYYQNRAPIAIMTYMPLGPQLPENKTK